MKKILRIVVAIIVIALGISAWLTIKEQNKMKEYSTYCMDKVRAELWEYLENVNMIDSSCSEWACAYMWSVTYEWVNYAYVCEVYDKESVEVALEPISYDVCEWETCDVPGTPEETNEMEEAQTYTIMWPNDWFDEQIQEWKLILRKGYEDHTDYIFIDQSLWQNYINSNEVAYGNEVSFKWNLTSIDWAAGSHYYNADTVEELNYVWVAVE